MNVLHLTICLQSITLTCVLSYRNCVNRCPSGYNVISKEFLCRVSPYEKHDTTTVTFNHHTVSKKRPTDEEKSNITYIVIGAVVGFFVLCALLIVVGNIVNNRSNKGTPSTATSNSRQSYRRFQNDDVVNSMSNSGRSTIRPPLVVQHV